MISIEDNIGKKNYSRLIHAFFIQLFILPCLAFQCSEHAATNKDTKHGIGDGIMENPRQALSWEKCHIDSVVWSHDGLSAHLYKDEQDTCTYRIASEAEEQWMSAYVYSEEVQISGKALMAEFVKSLDLLSMHQLDVIMGDSINGSVAILIKIVLDHQGNVVKVRYNFFNPVKEVLVDDYIKSVDERMRTVKFPDMKTYGINFNYMTFPITKKILREYMQRRLAE